MLTRRSLLGAAGLSIGAAALPAGPPDDRLPTLTRLDAAVRRIVTRLGGEARIERLGLSGGGRPIDLVSIGRGSRSVLLVGAPHANEPIGMLTILHLMERLAQDRRLRQDAGFSFHFIPVIDPDGVALNAGWIDAPLTLEHYLRDFYRPPFARQPEYSFPLDMPGYRFDAVTPENLCWQRALERTRPALQCSLHGSDSNGIFYLISAPRPALAARLSQLPDSFGFALNRLGEVGLGTADYAPGVMADFQPRTVVEEARAAGADPVEAWGAGDSSTDFARRRFGTFSMICEVALWDDPRLHDDRPSTTTMADVTADTLAQLREDRALYARLNVHPLRPTDSPDARALDLALAETIAGIDARIAQTAGSASANATAPLIRRDLVQHEAGLAAIRGMAMLARRARLSGDTSMASAAQAIVSRRIDAHLGKAKLRPIPYRRSAAFQAEAVLAAAAHLDDRSASILH